MLRYYNVRREEREQRLMMLNNEANKIGKVDGESDNETTE